MGHGHCLYPVFVSIFLLSISSYDVSLLQASDQPACYNGRMSSQDIPSRKPTPDELLARLNKEEQASRRGRLKLFLGFAAGVGKSYEMLTEAYRRKFDRNQDVVIGFIETHGRKGTDAQVKDLEIIPRQVIAYHDVNLEEMDLEAILKRHPRWVVVDELAHTNVPGSKNAKRYEDVIELLDAGINVLSAMNVQHLESLNDTVQQITGVKVRETVPDWVLGEASEVVTIDISPRALINRLQRGDIYAVEKVPTALSNFFTEGNLSALREIALREVAGAVDKSVQGYREEHGVAQIWQTCEKVMVCISPDKPSDKLLRRGWRISQRLRAGLIAVYIATDKITREQQLVLDEDFALAARLHIKIEQVNGKKIAETLAEYAQKNQVTQIVIGHSRRSRLQEALGGSVVNSLLALTKDIDVLVVAT
jgi:two-component system sensor histidine kinase KdpD